MVLRFLGRWMKRLVYVALIAGAAAGVYWAYATGELLKLLDWLVGQDPLLLTVIAVVALVGIAAIMSSR